MGDFEELISDIWGYIPDEDDLGWIDHVAEQPLDDSPLGDYGEIVRRMIKSGIAKSDIARFAKIVGYESAFGALFIASEDGLHESLLQGDPTGREMRPPAGT